MRYRKLLNEKTETVYKINNDRKRLENFINKVIYGYDLKFSRMGDVIEEIFTFDDSMDSVSFLKDSVTGVPSDVTVFLPYESMFIADEIISHIKYYIKQRWGNSRDWDNGDIGFEIKPARGDNFKIICYEVDNMYSRNRGPVIWNLSVIFLSH